MTAVVLALLSACMFAVSTVVQHRAATSASAGIGTGKVLRLIGALVSHRGWLAGQAAALTGFMLHAAALRHGAVVIVQPLLSSGLVMSLALGALVDRRHPGRPLPDRGQWLAAGAVVVALVVFVLSASPQHVPGLARPGPLTLCLAGFVVIAAAATLWARRPGAAHRALALAVTAGLGFGITGLLVKDVVTRSPGEWLFSWTTYVLLATGATSIVFAQWAYQSGALIESLPVMAVLEPLVAVGLAGPVYGERLAPGFWMHTGQVVGVVGLTVGVLVLARRSAANEVKRAEVEHVPVHGAIPPIAG